LSRKERREIYAKLRNQFGIEEELDLVFIKSGKRKIFVVSKELAELDLRDLRVELIGLYLAKLNYELRLTIEGTQLLGNFAEKNLVEIGEKEAFEWVRGLNLELREEIKPGYVIIKCKGDFLGCGRAKDREIENMIPKARRIKSLRGLK
jgi:NOL1/NOP2/fmu family ribosome biogenesis protein